MRRYRVSEIARAKGCSLQYIRKRARKEGWEGVRVNERGDLEFEFSDLPRDIKEALGLIRPELKEPAEEEMQAWLKSRKLSLSPARLIDPEVQAKLACARALEEAGWGDKGAVVKELALRYGKSEPTIRRWADEVEAWRVKDAAAPQIELTDGCGIPVTKIELPKTRKFEPEALAFGLSIYAKNLRNGQKAAYAALVDKAKQTGWEIGDYTNFTRAVSKIPQSIWDQIRKGAIGFEKDHIPKIIRAWLKIPVMTVLCGDQHIFDYQVFDPATDEVFTPECYLWMDCTSRYWPGVWPEFGPYNSFTVGLSLREACRYGIMDEVYTDWGKPEAKSKHMAQIIAGLSGYAAPAGPAEYRAKYMGLDGEDDGLEGVRHRKARAGVPWMKPIENQMNILERELANRFLEGYRKRDADAWVSKERNRHLKQARLQGRLMSIEEFLSVFKDLVSAHNNKECRVKEQDAPIIPASVFFSGLMRQSRVQFDERTLDYLFLPRFERMPRQSVVEVKVRGGDRRGFYSPRLSGLKEKVWVSVDPYDVEAPAIICDLDGNYIDLAEPWNVQDPRDTAGLRQKLIRQAQLRRWWKEQMVSVFDGFGLLKADEASASNAGRAEVIRVVPASRAAKQAADDAKARSELKPKTAEAGKKLERMFEAMTAGK